MDTEHSANDITVELTERVDAEQLNSEFPDQNDSAFTDLWNVGDRVALQPDEELSPSESLKFELETLAIEKERLMKEKKKLSEMLESLKLEEEIARMKKEVTSLDDENKQLQAEIQRRKSAIAQSA